MFKYIKWKRRSISLLAMRRFRLLHRRIYINPPQKRRVRHLLVIILTIATITYLLSTYALISYYKRHNLRTLTHCEGITREKRFEIRGNYFIFYNLVAASEHFECTESVTYATYSELGQLANLEAIVANFDGPISVAVYSPGDDFRATLRQIAFMRKCRHARIKSLVTFHLFFDAGHSPRKRPGSPLINAYKELDDCIAKLQVSNETHHPNYRERHTLPYPINIARNIAKNSAHTHFVLSVNSHMVPSKSLSKSFIEMLKSNALPQYWKPSVFVVPTFEVLKGRRIPGSKIELMDMMERNRIGFYQKLSCRSCYHIPVLNWWIRDVGLRSLSVYSVEKRWNHWIPDYIGARSDPMLDDGLTFEEGNYKLTEVYHLCLLNYSFLVLNNAFLVHNPAIPIKTIYNQKQRKSSQEILKITYGSEQHCTTD